MTRRLYYTDSHTTTFDAHPLNRITHDGHPALILDRTYFYPTGGGQPHDRGTINGVAVIDVIGSADHTVIHVLAAEVGGDVLHCEIDRARRLDLMQQHTGQHILTQAFVQLAGAQTVSFHLSEETVTIDLDQADIPAGVVAQVEALANQIITDNRPVSARLVDPDQAGEDIRIRKMPDILTTGGLRVIDIEGFDQTACGGTHVAHTGEIGLLKIISLTRRGEETRVEFRCGGRALSDYRAKHEVITRLSAELTVGYREVDQAVARLQAELKATRSALRAANARLIDLDAAEMLAAAHHQDDTRIICRAFADRDAGEVRALASRLIESPGVVVLLGAAGEKAQVIAARSSDLDRDMPALLKSVLIQLGTDRGGGRPEFAQGGGIAADQETLQTALEKAIGV